MRLTELALAMVLAGVYWLLFAFILSHTAAIGPPNWWYPTFGQNNASAITWLQITHSLGVISGAFPVAYVIVKFFPQTVLRISLVTGSLAGTTMLVHTVRGHLYLAKISSYAIEPFQLVSNILDVVTMPVLLLVVVWLISRAVPSNNALHLSS